MSIVLSESTQRHLTAFGHRRLKRGELVLLGKAIAARLPIGTGMPENIRTYTLNYRNTIDSMIFGLSNYMYIPQQDVEHLYAIVDGFLLWRMSVAFDPQPVIFSGKANVVIDEMSALVRFVDVGDLCAVGDIASSATTLEMVFHEYTIKQGECCATV